MITTRMMPSREVVQHGMGGEVHQIAAIDERDHLHARGQNRVVQLLHFFVNSLQRRVGVGAFAQERDAGHHIVVIDDLSVFVPDRPGELAQPDFRALRDHGDVLHAQRSAVLRRDDRVLDVAARSSPGPLPAR